MSLDAARCANFSLLLLSVLVAGAQPRPTIWNEAQVDSWTIPLAKAEVTPSYLRAEYFNRIPVRSLYKSYPMYHPDKEPAGYWDSLLKAEPQIIWDGSGTQPALHTEQHWLRAGELVYDAGVNFAPATARGRTPEAFAALGLPVAADGTVPGLTYVIRTKGTVEVGYNSCATCHSRVLPDGSVQKGTQGNLPFARLHAQTIRAGGPASLDSARRRLYEYYGAPWHEDDPTARINKMSLEEIAQVFDSIPAGVYPNHNSSPFYPIRTADLLGLDRRRYLDHTGHHRHRDPSDLMRFADFHQRSSIYARFGQFHPRPIPKPEDDERYSDEQVWALARFIYSIKAPPNPNKPDALSAKGKKIFEQEGCGGCHTPPLYTNNKLTPVAGFRVPPDHPEKAHILPVSVGTDPTNALKSRKGTGFYKVPHLLGVWFRGPFEHNGSVATLEDWFDPARLRDDYVPTGFKGYGVTTRAIKGHEYGLKLLPEDKRALIAFLKTL